MSNRINRVFPIRQEEFSYFQNVSEMSYFRPMGKSRKMPVDSARAKIQARVAELGLDMKQISTDGGKNHSYLSQYITKGSPKKLPEDFRRHLAQCLEWEEWQLGGPKAVVERPLSKEELLSSTSPPPGISAVPTPRIKPAKKD